MTDKKTQNWRITPERRGELDDVFKTADQAMGALNTEIISLRQKARPGSLTVKELLDGLREVRIAAAVVTAQWLRLAEVFDACETDAAPDGENGGANGRRLQ